MRADLPINPLHPGDNNGNEVNPALRAGLPIAPVLPGVKDNNVSTTPEGVAISNCQADSF